jgi:hypothetical protein
MKNCIFIFTVFIVVALLACAPYTVKSDFDSEADYAGYRSFAMHDQSDLKIRAPLVYKRVIRAVSREMEAKGYQEAALDRADVLIAVHGSSRQKVNVTTYGYGYRWRATDVHKYQEGTLIIDIVDSKANELVWRGSATGVLSDNPGQDEQKVAEVVSAVLAKYPPQNK